LAKLNFGLDGKGRETLAVYEGSWKE